MGSSGLHNALKNIKIWKKFVNRFATFAYIAKAFDAIFSKSFHINFKQDGFRIAIAPYYSHRALPSPAIGLSELLNMTIALLGLYLIPRKS